VGRLTVLRRDTRKGNAAYWVCACDCGATISVNGSDLRRPNRGRDKSCGCAAIRPDAEVVNAYSRYKASARLRDIPFDIGLEEFKRLVTANCVYCGAAPSVSSCKPKYFHRVAMNGVDRKDSRRGYLEGNVAPCCAVCNQMKFDYTQEEFIHQCRKVADYGYVP
jgi:hypothetical protein